MNVRQVSIHGHKMAFRTAGSGPVLMLVHGMAGSSATWRYVMPALARHFTVIAPDLLGHGESAKPRTDYSLGAYASGIRDLMTTLGHERATIIGQSFGGGVAMQLAYQFPERCERLVLVGSGGLGTEVSTILRGLSIPGASWVLPLGCRQSLCNLGKKVAALSERIGRSPNRAAVEMGRAYAALTDAETRRAFVLTLRSVVDHQGQRVSARDRLYLSSDMPTLIIWGRDDPIIPVRHALDAHAALPGSRLEIFSEVGHFPHCEAPERFVSVVTAFIRDTRPAAVSAERFAALLTGSYSP